MENVSVRDASEIFGLSKARIYKLLGDGIIKGELSQKRGRGSSSWVDVKSLQEHINIRDEKARRGGRGKKGVSGRHKITGNDIYIPVAEAAQKSGYSPRHIDFLAREGRVASKQAIKGGRLVDYRDLMNYKYRK